MKHKDVITWVWKSIFGLVKRLSQTDRGQPIVEWSHNHPWLSHYSPLIHKNDIILSHQYRTIHDYPTIIPYESKEFHFLLHYYIPLAHLVNSWRLIPLAKWVIILLISELTLLIPQHQGYNPLRIFLGWATKYGIRKRISSSSSYTCIYIYELSWLSQYDPIIF